MQFIYKNISYNTFRKLKNAVKKNFDGSVVYVKKNNRIVRKIYTHPETSYLNFS